MNDYDVWMKDYLKKQKQGAIEVAKLYSERKINSKEELDDLIQDLMIEYGQDGHCDGSEIIAEILWQKLVEKK